MWVFFAFGSAFFAGVTAVLAKCGIRTTDSAVATAIRTCGVLVFAWSIAWVAGSVGTIGALKARTLAFLALSGLATGASWLCYFRALQIGNVNRVAAVDKSSIVLTVILSFVILGERVSPAKLSGLALIAAGTYLMIAKKSAAPAADAARRKGHSWFFFAALSALFAALTSILGKIGIEGVESNLGTALRTCVVLVMSWAAVASEGKLHLVRTVPRSELAFILASSAATGASCSESA